jgi:hypothetical protein
LDIIGGQGILKTEFILFGNQLRELVLIDDNFLVHDIFEFRFQFKTFFTSFLKNIYVFIELLEKSWFRGILKISFCVICMIKLAFEAKIAFAFIAE